MTRYKHLIRTKSAVQVRIVYSYIDISQLFTFKKHGGVRKAYKAALAFRDIHLKRLQLLGFVNQRVPNRISKKSHGIIGVYLSRATNGSLLWTASYRKNAKGSRKSFSVNRYGNRTAFQLACQFRFLRIGTLIIVDRSSLPCMPKVPYR